MLEDYPLTEKVSFYTAILREQNGRKRLNTYTGWLFETLSRHYWRKARNYKRKTLRTHRNPQSKG